LALQTYTVNGVPDLKSEPYIQNLPHHEKSRIRYIFQLCLFENCSRPSYTLTIIHTFLKQIVIVTPPDFVDTEASFGQENSN